MQIDKGISVPPVGGTQWGYPFAQLEVGDSFQVPFEDGNKMRLQANRFRKFNPGWNYTTRTTIDNTVRLWRIA